MQCWPLLLLSPHETTVASLFSGLKIATVCAAKNKHHRRPHRNQEPCEYLGFSACHRETPHPGHDQDRDSSPYKMHYFHLTLLFHFTFCLHDILKLKFIFSDCTPFFSVRFLLCLFMFSSWHSGTSILSSVILSMLCAAPQLFSIHKDFWGFMNIIMLSLCSFPVRFPIYTWLAQGHITKSRWLEHIRGGM